MKNINHSIKLETNKEQTENQESSRKFKIETVLAGCSSRYGAKPLYYETPESWKIWDHYEKKWIMKLKINYQLEALDSKL